MPVLYFNIGALFALAAVVIDSRLSRLQGRLTAERDRLQRLADEREGKQRYSSRNYPGARIGP